jgi:hypothetical protein
VLSEFSDLLREKPALTFALGSAFFAYHAGEGLRYSVGPAPTQLIGFASTTSSIAAVTLNFTTFASLPSPPPLVPPSDKQSQT